MKFMILFIDIYQPLLKLISVFTEEYLGCNVKFRTFDMNFYPFLGIFDGEI